MPGRATVHHVLDRGSRTSWRLTGRRVDLRGAESWRQDGAYGVVRGDRDARERAARVPLHETFHVHVDDRGVLRTDRLERVS